MSTTSTTSTGASICRDDAVGDNGIQTQRTVACSLYPNCSFLPSLRCYYQSAVIFGSWPQLISVGKEHVFLHTSPPTSPTMVCFVHLTSLLPCPERCIGLALCLIKLQWPWDVWLPLIARADTSGAFRVGTKDLYCNFAADGPKVAQQGYGPKQLDRL